MPLSPGDVFAGYTVIRQLGTGGMGTVYLVRHPRLPRNDALKLMRPDLSADPAFAARFLHEAEVVAGLSHRNIVSVLDRGEEGGQLWLTMRHVDGIDCEDALARSGGLLPAGRAVRIITEVAAALDFAHRRHLVHRDVKPANILLAASSDEDEPEQVFLTDFGIAKSLDATSTRLTATGAVVATFDYASPEQIESRPLDARSDVYSLACVLHRLLTGTVPYPGHGVATAIHGHLTQPPPRPTTRVPWLAPEIDSVIARAMAKDPDDRYPTCRAFAIAATAAVMNFPTPPGPPYRLSLMRGSGRGPTTGPIGTDRLPQDYVEHLVDLVRRTRFFDLPETLLDDDEAIPATEPRRTPQLVTIGIDAGHRYRQVVADLSSPRRPPELDDLVTTIERMPEMREAPSLPVPREAPGNGSLSAPVTTHFPVIAPPQQLPGPPVAPPVGAPPTTVGSAAAPSQERPAEERPVEEAAAARSEPVLPAASVAAAPAEPVEQAGPAGAQTQAEPGVPTAESRDPVAEALTAEFPVTQAGRLRSPTPAVVAEPVQRIDFRPPPVAAGRPPGGGPPGGQPPGGQPPGGQQFGGQQFGGQQFGGPAPGGQQHPGESPYGPVRTAPPPGGPPGPPLFPPQEPRPQRKRGALVALFIAVAVLVAGGATAFLLLRDSGGGGTGGGGTGGSASSAPPSSAAATTDPALAALPRAATPLSVDTIVVARDVDDNVDLYLQDSHSGAVVGQLTTGPETDTGAVLSPDRATVVFIEQSGDTRELWAVATDGSGARPLFAQPLDGCANPGRPAWDRASPGQLAITCTDDNGALSLRIVGLDGTTVRSLDPGHPYLDDLSFSPDGTRLVYWATDSDGVDGGRIYSLAADGSAQPVQLTDSAPGVDADPIWSPDGTLIAFRRAVSDNERQIFLMNADGSNQQSLTNGSVDQDPSWSPDGVQLAFKSSREGPHATGGDHVWLINQTGRRLRELSTGSITNAPAWGDR